LANAQDVVLSEDAKEYQRNAEIVLNHFTKIALFLITGNSADFTFTQYKQTQILSPRSFWEILTHYK